MPLYVCRAMRIENQVEIILHTLICHSNIDWTSKDPLKLSLALHLCDRDFVMISGFDSASNFTRGFYFPITTYRNRFESQHRFSAVAMFHFLPLRSRFLFRVFQHCSHSLDRSFLEHKIMITLSVILNLLLRPYFFAFFRLFFSEINYLFRRLW